MNLPLRRITGARDVEPPVRVTGDGVVVEAVLPAHDGSGDLVVRVYEALGNRVEAVIRASGAVRGWQRTDLLERGLAAWEDGGEARLSPRPFELCTVRFRPAGAAPA